MLKTHKDWAVNGLHRLAHDRAIDLLDDRPITEDEAWELYEDVFIKQLAKLQRKVKKEAVEEIKLTG